MRISVSCNIFHAHAMSFNNMNTRNIKLSNRNFKVNNLLYIMRNNSHIYYQTQHIMKIIIHGAKYLITIMLLVFETLKQ